MPSFTKGGGIRPPFGKNQYLRSTKGMKFESATIYNGSVPYETIDGTEMRILQSGEVLAKITSGPGIGMVGPFQASGTQEVQTATKTGTWSGGTYAVSVTVLGVAYTALAIPYNATAAAVQAALEAQGMPTNSIVFTGGPLSTTPLVATFNTSGGNVSPLVIDTTLVTGTTPAVGIVETTPGVAGATDGRGTTSNIVGIAETFLPWELNERNHDLSYTYDAAVNQAWCFERNAAGARVPLSNTTRDAILALPGLSILFK
jgi:hypothetical protein